MCTFFWLQDSDNDPNETGRPHSNWIHDDVFFHSLWTAEACAARLRRNRGYSVDSDSD